MTTAARAPGTTPNPRVFVALAVVVLLIPALLTALLVATAARAEPENGSSQERTPASGQSERLQTPYGKELSGE